MTRIEIPSRFLVPVAATLLAGLSWMGAARCCLCQDGSYGPATQQSRRAYEAIQKGLDQRGSFHFDGTPLDEALTLLGRQYRLPIRLDVKSLADVGIGLDVPARLDAADITLRSALKLVLGDLDLDFFVKNEVLMVSNPETCEKQEEVRVYWVQDLVAPEGARCPIEQDCDYDSLIDLITSLVQPTTWPTVGGPGSVYPFRGTVVFSQTQDAHEECADLLFALRQATRDPSHAVRVRRAAQAAGDEKVFKALLRPASLHFDKTPLSRALASIAVTHGVPVYLDRRALGDEKTSTQTPVSVHVAGVSLRSALRLALEPLGLTYLVKHEVLFVTASEKAQTELEIVVYPVGDLRTITTRCVPAPTPGILPQTPSMGGGFFRLTQTGPMPPPPCAQTVPYATYDPLVNLVRNVASDTWDTSHGPGSLMVFRDLLCCSQTQDMQEQVAALLADLRRNVAKRPPAAADCENHAGWDRRFGRHRECR